MKALQKINIENFFIMANFVPEVKYAQKIIARRLPNNPYGVIGNKGNIPVDPDKVVLKEDGATPDALSLPRNAYITVDFGENKLINEDGADLEIRTVDGANEFARIEYVADAYYENGTTESKYSSQILKADENGGDSLLIDIEKDVNFENKEDISFISVDNVKITGLDNRGDSPGFEVYEIKGINTVNTSLINQEISRLIEIRNANIDPITGSNNSGLVGSFIDSIKSGDFNFDGVSNGEDAKFATEAALLGISVFAGAGIPFLVARAYGLPLAWQVVRGLGGFTASKYALENQLFDGVKDQIEDLFELVIDKTSPEELFGFNPDTL